MRKGKRAEKLVFLRHNNSSRESTAHNGELRKHNQRRIENIMLRWLDEEHKPMGTEKAKVGERARWCRNVCQWGSERTVPTPNSFLSIVAIISSYRVHRIAFWRRSKLFCVRSVARVAESMSCNKSTNTFGSDHLKLDFQHFYSPTIFFLFVRIVKWKWTFAAPTSSAPRECPKPRLVFGRKGFLLIDLQCGRTLVRR